MELKESRRATTAAADRWTAAGPGSRRIPPADPAMDFAQIEIER
jgi:hypothetical protein